MDNTRNTRTLIATFDDYSTARQAARELEDSGVPTTAIHIDSNRKTAGAGSTQQHNPQEHESGFKEWWNSLFGAGDHDEEQRDYERALSSGSTIMRVTLADGDINSAVAILNRNGAHDVGTPDQASDRQASDRQASDRQASGTTSSGAIENAGNRPVQVVEEELQVGKRAVQRGGVRVYSHVVSEPVEQEVRLREEHVKVERRQVDREISPDEVNTLRDRTIEVVEMAEEPVIAKRARVREEIVVGKESTERTQTIRDNVRHTEVEVDQMGTDRRASGNFGAPSSATQDFTDDYRSDFRRRYGQDADFAAMQPAYEYGYRSASNPVYGGGAWDEAEPRLRSDYERSNPSGKWEQVKQSVRYGWEKVTGTR